MDDRIAKANNEVKHPFLVIAKRQYERGGKAECPPSTEHFFAFAIDEGEAIRGVRMLLLEWHERAMENAKSLDLPGGIWQGMPMYQFTVKKVEECQASIGSRVFAL